MPAKTDYVTPINLTLYSLFKDLNVKINGHQVKKKDKFGHVIFKKIELS